MPQLGSSPPTRPSKFLTTLVFFCIFVIVFLPILKILIVKARQLKFSK